LLHYLSFPQTAEFRRLSGGVSLLDDGHMLLGVGVDRLRCADQEQRVAVRRRMGDRFGADIAAGARPIVDDE
jgi:hypothetical protein